MVIYCYLCGKKQQKGKLQPSMHRFPKNEQLRSLWIEACGLLANDDVSTLKICSTHFRPKDYLEPMSKILGSHLRLKAGVVPSVRVPNVVPLLNWADNFQSSVNEIGIIEEVVETSCPDANENQEVTLIPINCACADSQGWTEIEPDDNNSPKGGMETFQEVIENIPVIHEDHLYTSPFKRKSPLTQCRRNTVTQCNHVTGTPLQPTSAAPIWQVEVGSPRKRRFIEPRYVSEVELSDLTTDPKVAHRTLAFIKTANKTQKKKIKILQDKVARLKKQVEQLKGTIAREQEEKDEINLINALPETIKNILLRKTTNGRYSDELKTFAITLYSCSPKAYNYVRKFWGKLLPHPTTITEWQKDSKKAESADKEACEAVQVELLNSELIIDDVTVKDEIILDYTDAELEVICGEDELEPESGSLTLYAVDQQD